jgi:hypothetical protein
VAAFRPQASLSFAQEDWIDEQNHLIRKAVFE